MNKLLNFKELGLSGKVCRKLVAVGIITDGYFGLKRCRNTMLIEFYSNDVSLHEMFQYFMKIGFNRNKTSYYHYSKNNRVLVTGYELSRKDPIIKYLQKLSSTYTTNKNFSEQPTINFLFNESQKFKEIAIRFAMSCEGCISVAHLKSGKNVPSLKFACAHPTLVNEWKKLFSEVGINTSLDKDRANWSNIHGLRTSSQNDILAFQKIGGFSPNFVKVQVGNYQGLTKNQVLNGVCNWFLDKNKCIDNIISNYSPRNSPRPHFLHKPYK